MALRPNPSSSWMSGLDFPNQLFEMGQTDYELYEEDDEFVLSVEMPGFDSDEIEVGWHEGRLTVAAEQHDERRDQSRTYRRYFRMPKEIDDENIRARYQNGMLDVHLPSVEEGTVKGKTIPIEG